MRSDFLRDVLELGGLVTEHHQIGPPGDLPVGGERLSADLCREAPCPLGDGIGAHHGTAPPAGQRAGHVPATDETYLHEWLRLSVRGSGTGRLTRQIESGQDAVNVAYRTKIDRHANPRGHRQMPEIARQDWLKKPFSISRARSSAEISTLRGVSMNTLSAMRCMPPSSA